MQTFLNFLAATCIKKAEHQLVNVGSTCSVLTPGSCFLIDCSSRPPTSSSISLLNRDGLSVYHLSLQDPLLQKWLTSQKMVDLFGTAASGKCTCYTSLKASCDCVWKYNALLKMAWCLLHNGPKRNECEETVQTTNLLEWQESSIGRLKFPYHTNKILTFKLWVAWLLGYTVPIQVCILLISNILSLFTDMPWTSQRYEIKLSYLHVSSAAVVTTNYRMFKKNCNPWRIIYRVSTKEI
jgi:hypothetical protein